MSKPISETMNVKGNRKVVYANYQAMSQFKIPDGVDLEDKSVVEKWYIYGDVLNIHFVGKDEPKQIEPFQVAYDDFVHLMRPTNDEYGIDDYLDEEFDYNDLYGDSDDESYV